MSKDLVNFIKSNIDTVLISFLGFFILAPLAIVNPLNVDWILDFSGISDLAFTWLGWVFFKSAPFFQLPFFATPGYGLDGGSNIVFSGSIPLFALIFKPFSNYLPYDFQYYGIWIYSSIFLHCYFSKKILEIFTNDKILISLMTVLFVTSPVFLHRVYIPHIGLLAQWLLLFSIYLLLRKNFCYKFWSINLALSLLVHGYLFMFSLILFSTDLIIKNKIKLNLDSFKIFYVYFSMLALMFVLGYFSGDSGGISGGYGYYSMNLNSLINPSGIHFSEWSSILPNLPTRPLEKFYADYEGFNYLGLGLLILVPFALFKINKLISLLKENRKKTIVILIMMLMVSLMAISNHVGVGDNAYVFGIGSELTSYLSNFRASGRFFWINYYLIYCFIFLGIAKFYPRRFAILLLIFAISFHLYDTKENIYMIKERFALSSNYNRAHLDLEKTEYSIFWKKIAENYKEINMIYPEVIPTDENIFRLTYFAAKNELKINAGYFARINRDQLQNEKIQLNSILKSGQLNKEVIYVIRDENLWLDLKKRFTGKLYFKEIPIEKCVFKKNCTLRLLSSSELIEGINY
tara:strand:+ start:2802 stop:4526 length:1725 start_codon:yes stop_codon:yes gene_type:complete